MPDQSTDDLDAIRRGRTKSIGVGVNECRQDRHYRLAAARKAQALLARAEAAEAETARLREMINLRTSLHLMGQIEELAAERDQLQHDLDAALDMMAGDETPPAVLQLIRAARVDAVAGLISERDHLLARVDQQAQQLLTLAAELAAAREVLCQVEAMLVMPSTTASNSDSFGDPLRHSGVRPCGPERKNGVSDAFRDNPEVYMIVGDLDKPFHLPECECKMCEEWRREQGRPTHEELKALKGGAT